jgi:hypothetical protein
MRMLPATQLSPRLQTSPLPAMETALPDPTLLEWYPQPSYSSSLHVTEVQELRARIEYLEAEAQRNIELRAELRQDFCKLSTEVLELRDIVNNLGKQVSTEVRELGEIVNSLGK